MSKPEVNRCGQDMRDPALRCKLCVGSGKMLGGGMMQINCSECLGEGYNIPKAEINLKDIKIDKSSHHYQKAIKNIKALNDKMNDQEAEKIFADEFEKLK